MRTSPNRVASIHIAKLKKEAKIKKKVAELASAPFMAMVDSGSKKVYRDLIPDESKKGWALLGKEFKPSQVIKELKSGGQPFDLSDPLQKVVYSSIKGKSPLQQIEIVGTFNQALSEKNIDKMSEVLSFDKHALTLILLWYSRNKRARDASLKDFDRAMATQPATLARWIEIIPKKTIRLVEYFTGGALIEWMLKIIPHTSVAAKPLKWGWWIALYLDRKMVIYNAVKWGSAALSWLAKSLSIPSFVKGMVAFGFEFIKTMSIAGSVPIVFITGAILTYMIFHGRDNGFYYHLNKTNIILYLYGHIKYAWRILTAVIKGALVVPKYIYDEIIGWWKDIKTTVGLDKMKREVGTPMKLKKG